MGVRSSLAAIASPFTAIGRRWRGSMLWRVGVTVLVVGMATLVVLGVLTSSLIRDGLVDSRIDRILAEVERDRSETQLYIDNSTAETTAELQSLVFDLWDNLNTLGGGNRELVLLEAPSNQTGVGLSSSETSQGIREVITPAMRSALSEGTSLPWQPVQMPDGSPGVAVGTTINIGAAGAYQLFFVYSLADEQATLDLVSRALLIGAGVLLILLLWLVWFVTVESVRPVRAAARTAARLADGRLSERMTVRGVDEMATLASTFNDMAASLERQITKMETLSKVQLQFVSDVSHELRTPLTTIRMASDVLHDNRADFPPAVARSAELLDAQLDRFEALLADLLEISRIDAGAARLDTDRVSVLTLVRDEVAAILPAAVGMGVEIRLWAGSGDHVASVDRPRIARIVRNLLSNAIEHAQGEPVDVIVASDARAVCVVVRDYGVGLGPGQVEHVFDRFWRADAARARTMGGTGLGLSIAREDAALHGGTLEAWGQRGKGASFRLALPTTEATIGHNLPLPVVVRRSAFEELGTLVAVDAPGAATEVTS